MSALALESLPGRSHRGGSLLTGRGVHGTVRAGSRAHLAGLAIIALSTLLVFAPTLRNGFLPLGFDDALITDTVALRALTWPNLRALFSEFNHAHYVPLTMLTLAVDYRFWGLDPVGYHLTNILLHALTATLVCVFLWPLLNSTRLAVLAAMIFALHPLQMEAVSVAIQRKSVLSGALFFLTFILYQRWRSDGRWSVYVGCLLVFVAAALAKPTVVMLPSLLLLYDYTFYGRPLRVAEKVPFFVIAALVSMVTVQAHAAVGALHGPHGGNELANPLMVSRVTLEYVDALFLPLNLSPIYYYQPAIVYAPVNLAAAVLIVGGSAWVTWNRRRSPFAFFCLWWFLLTLLPESNLVPVAQLRADRFLYLSLLGFALWVAVALRHLDARWFWYRELGTRLVGPAIVGVSAIVCYTSAGVWQDDVSAWRRVVVRHPWCAMAHHLLGRAHYEQHDAVRAEREFATAVRLSERLSEAHLYLAKVYAERGQIALAQAEVRRLLELAPADADGLALRAALLPPEGA